MIYVNDVAVFVGTDTNISATPLSICVSHLRGKRYENATFSVEDQYFINLIRSQNRRYLVIKDQLLSTGLDLYKHDIPKGAPFKIGGRRIRNPGLLSYLPWSATAKYVEGPAVEHAVMRTKQINPLQSVQLSYFNQDQLQEIVRISERLGKHILQCRVAGRDLNIFVYRTAGMGHLVLTDVDGTITPHDMLFLLPCCLRSVVAQQLTKLAPLISDKPVIALCVTARNGGRCLRALTSMVARRCFGATVPQINLVRQMWPLNHKLRAAGKYLYVRHIVAAFKQASGGKPVHGFGDRESDLVAFAVGGCDTAQMV